MSTRTQTQLKAAPKPSFTPVQGGLLQRKCACGGAAGMSGKCEECSKKKRFGLQTKLKVNEPGDIYEQEADRIVDQVMAMPAGLTVSGAPPRIQRFSEQSNGQMDAAPASVDQVLASPGRPLEPALRQDMEQRFGHDFSRVRVHSGAAAEQSAQDVNAKAYTVGHNIVLGAGRFTEGTNEGRRLIAHELTHVVQQSGVDAIRVQRQGGSTSAPTPAPPGWLGSWRASAVHVQGDIWDVKLPSLGRSWVGPYDQLSAYINKQGFAGKMQAAHIVGGEHLADLNSPISYEKAPCIAVANELHLTWTKKTSALQSQEGVMGGRATKSVGRPVSTPDTPRDLIHVYHEIYSAHPELQEMARKIVRSAGKGAHQASMKTPSTTAATTTKTTKPMRAQPGGGPRGTISATTKTVMSHKQSNPEVSTSNRPSNLGTPEYSAAPPTPGTSQLPKGSVFEAKKPIPPVLLPTPPLPKGSILETGPIASTPKVDTESQPTKGAPPPAGGGPSRAVTTVSGEITVPKVPPAGLAESALSKTEPLTTGGPPASPAKRVTIAPRGAPVEAIPSPAPAAAKVRAAAKVGLGFGAQAILAAQLASVRGAEAAKAAAALEKLVPQIEKLRLAGNGVVVTLVVEAPNKVDIAAIWAGIGDPGQVVYFKKMYISQVIPAKKSGVASTQTTMSANLAPGDPEQVDPHEMTLTQQIEAQMGEKYPVKELRPRKGFHYVSRELSLPALTESEKPGGRTREGATIEASRPPAQPVKTKPRLDPATKKALALAPSRVYILTGNIIQYKTAYEIMKKIAGDASFGEVKESMAGLNRSRTVVSYRSDLDSPRAEALAEIVRSEGVSSAYVELSGDGDDAPGVLQIFFGRDAEK